MPQPTLTGVASSGRSSGTQTTLTVSHTSNGDHLWAVVAIFGSAGTIVDVGTCTYGGTALRFMGGYALGTYTFNLFRLTSPTPGTANIVFTNSGAPDARFTGLGAFNSSGDLDAIRLAIRTGSSTTPSVPIVCESTLEFIIDMVVADDVSQTFTPDASQSQIVQNTDATSNIHLSLSSKAGSVGTVTMSQTLGSSDVWTHIAFPLVGSAASGGGAGGVGGPTLGEAWG